MTQVDDLSRSLDAFDQNTSLVVVVEMSEARWLGSVELDFPHFTSHGRGCP